MFKITMCQQVSSLFKKYKQNNRRTWKSTTQITQAKKKKQKKKMNKETHLVFSTTSSALWNSNTLSSSTMTSRVAWTSTTSSMTSLTCFRLLTRRCSRAKWSGRMTDVVWMVFNSVRSRLICEATTFTLPCCSCSRSSCCCWSSSSSSSSSCCCCWRGEK